ncbi:MAG: hypothetical protein WCH74_03740 [Chloroflexota bacterium]
MADQRPPRDDPDGAGEARPGQTATPPDVTDATTASAATAADGATAVDATTAADDAADDWIAADDVAAADARVTRRLAIGAVAIALVAIGLTAWRFLAPTAASCQSTAWDAAPSTAGMPAGWSIGATQYDADRMSMTLVGPVPEDQVSAQAVVYATITCYAHDAAGAVTRSQAAATAAGQNVSVRTDLGDQGYTALDPSGASFVQFRTGDVVASVAASSDATAAEVEAAASAFDRALGGDGSSAAIGTPEPSSGISASPSVAASAAPSTSPEPVPSAIAAAPELEAVLPGTVAETALTIDSALGSAVLGDDAGSRAIIAALRAEDKTPDDLRLAQAYDPNGTLDLSVVAFQVEGLQSAALQKIVLDTWLSATGTGVTTSTITLGGREFTRIDYGDGGSMSYVTTDGDIVIVIETSDADLAAQAAAALP